MQRGVVYVAYGAGALREAEASIKSLRRAHRDWPVAVVSGEAIAGAMHIAEPARAGKAGRWAKVNLFRLTPFAHSLYLDADTRVKGDLSFGFRALDAGWDLVMVPSRSEAFWQLRGRELTVTLAELGDPPPVMLNTGVMWFRRSARMDELSAAWEEEWARFRGRDQAALLRALRQRPVRLLLLGWPFNSLRGEVVEHLFGRAKR